MFRKQLRSSFGVILSFGLMLVLAACSSTTATLVPTPLATNSNPTSVGVTQPKVVRMAIDTRGARIEFTEPPVLNDGVPAFLWFETET